MDLFRDYKISPPLPAGAFFLKEFACPYEAPVLEALDKIVQAAPFRQMGTRRGYRMSVAMTSCGEAGWISDQKGYRYVKTDPDSGKPWPAMPKIFLQLAGMAAQAAGYEEFLPDSCLINRYQPGSKMALHQDKDEGELNAPVVSVSFGVPANFMFGGPERTSPVRKIILEHGDVFVWGGPARLFYHGIAPLKEGYHPLLGNLRINLTFRKAL